MLLSCLAILCLCAGRGLKDEILALFSFIMTVVSVLVTYHMCLEGRENGALLSLQFFFPV